MYLTTLMRSSQSYHWLQSRLPAGHYEVRGNLRNRWCPKLIYVVVAVLEDTCSKMRTYMPEVHQTLLEEKIQEALLNSFCLMQQKKGDVRCCAFESELGPIIEGLTPEPGTLCWHPTKPLLIQNKDLTN